MRTRGGETTVKLAGRSRWHRRGAWRNSGTATGWILTSAAGAQRRRKTSFVVSACRRRSGIWTPNQAT